MLPQPITFPDFKPGELAFLAASGRAFRVQVSEVVDFDGPIARQLGLPEDGPEYLGDHYLAFQATQADPATGSLVVGIDNATVIGPLHGRHIPGSLIANGQDSHQEHWRLFADLKDAAMNAVPPDGIAAGKVVKDTKGAGWYAGYGHPDSTLKPEQGKVGDFYQDLSNGAKYKCRQGLLHFHACNIADELDKSLTAIADRESLKLPTL